MVSERPVRSLMVFRIGLISMVTNPVRKKGAIVAEIRRSVQRLAGSQRKSDRPQPAGGSTGLQMPDHQLQVLPPTVFVDIQTVDQPHLLNGRVGPEVGIDIEGDGVQYL